MIKNENDENIPGIVTTLVGWYTAAVQWKKLTKKNVDEGIELKTDEHFHGISM